MIEIWNDVIGFEGIYQVSSEGRVKSLARLNAGGQRITGRMMRLELDKYGYLRVGLTKNRDQKHYLVSRLVAISFISNRHSKETVNHIDGDKKNNHVSNLEWATVREQNSHMLKMIGGYAGSKNPNSKLTETQVKKVKALLLKKVTLKVIAKRFGVSFGLIGLIKQGRIWRHVN